MKKFMERAFALARKTDPFPNPRVGAVLVKKGKIIGEGYHRKAGMPHAEIEAIKDAKRRTGNAHAAAGATLYVTLEPCSHKNKRTPPCTSDIIAERIKKVVFAMKDPNPLVCGEKVLRKAGVKVVGPMAERKAAAINNRYIRNLSKKPFVAIKMAMSVDGRTATKAGDSKWITGKKARQYVHRMRGQFDAVMVGSRTIEIDNPRLTARLKGASNPRRIIVDSDLCIPSDSNVLENKDGKTIIATTEKAPKEKLANMRNAFVCGKKRVDMRRLVQCLSAMGIKRVMIEGGSELNASAMEAGIVDKLYIFVAPKIIGGRDAKGVIGGKGIAKMKDAKMLKNMKIRRFGEDLLLEFDVR
jgi:diaminohydroxyphosphoribosylaminopyrimidine deaminase/5-amino-6-(5-phosphoribosylamino)uracil reductase